MSSLPLEIDCRSVHSRLAAQDGLVLIDCREADEHATASIAGARQFVAEAQAVPNVVRIESIVSAPNVPAGVWAGYTGDPATLPAELQPYGQPVAGCGCY